MTASNRNDSKLEESIKMLDRAIRDPSAYYLPGWLHAFAEAVRENSTCRICMLRDDWVRENLCAEHKRDAEPKECECGIFAHNKSCPRGINYQEPPAALPDEVKERIELILMAEGEKMTHVRSLLEDLCRLCLSLRKP